MEVIVAEADVSYLQSEKNQQAGKLSAAASRATNSTQVKTKIVTKMAQIFLVVK